MMCKKCCMFTVSSSETLPLQPKNCQNSYALLRSCSIIFLVSKIQLLLTYVLELLYFLQHFPAKHSVPMHQKRYKKKTTQKIEILIDIFKKSFNPAYVELELVPFYFWVFKKNPFSKKT